MVVQENFLVQHVDITTEMIKRHIGKKSQMDQVTGLPVLRESLFLMESSFLVSHLLIHV